MVGLTIRIRELERRRSRPDVCPEHATATPHRDYRAGPAPFLPPEMRAGLPEPDAPAPCGRCGFRWGPAFEVVTREDWGQHGTP
jgi:hypothetical protein